VSVHRKRITLLSAFAGLAFAALIFAPLLMRNMSAVTQGVLIGIAGVACLLGIGFGVWDARRIEARRKAKERIWLKH
jgi:hypothetical protein